jgi:SnoaL-like domain
MNEVSVPLPTVIRQYQEAHDRHDIDTALATFAATATVIDENQEWSGIEEIRTWLVKTSTEYTFTRTLLGAHADGEHSWVVRNRLEGNFPGNIVELRYRFTLDVDGDRILGLSIAP